MSLYKKIKYPALLLCSVCLCLGAFASTTVLTALDQEIEDGQPKRARIEVPSKKELLLEHLPLQIEVLTTLQERFHSIMDDQRDKNQLAAFKAACSITNLKAFSSSIQDVLSCLRSTDPVIVSIGIGSAPALKQEIDQLIVYLDEAQEDSSPFKALAAAFQKIVEDIPQPEFPADAFV